MAANTLPPNRGIKAKATKSAVFGIDSQMRMETGLPCKTRQEFPKSPVIALDIQSM
jgi:hypothetical protein